MMPCPLKRPLQASLSSATAMDMSLPICAIGAFRLALRIRNQNQGMDHRLTIPNVSRWVLKVADPQAVQIILEDR